MQRRRPFCTAGTPDLVKMMIGIPASEDIESRLQEVYRNLGRIWSRMICAKTEPIDGGKSAERANATRGSI